MDTPSAAWMLLILLSLERLVRKAHASGRQRGAPERLRRGPVAVKVEVGPVRPGERVQRHARRCVERL